MIEYEKLTFLACCAGERWVAPALPTLAVTHSPIGALRYGVRFIRCSGQVRYGLVRGTDLCVCDVVM